MASHLTSGPQNSPQLIQVAEEEFIYENDEDFYDETDFPPHGESYTLDSRNESRKNSIFTITQGLKQMPNLVNSEANKVFKTLNTSPMYDPFTKKSFASVALSMTLNLVDYGSDIGVAVLLYNEENTDWWFTLTMILILVPLLLVNAFSIFWFHQDHIRERQATTFREGGFCPVRQRFSSKERAAIIAFHCFLIGPILRYLYILFCGWKEYQNQGEVVDPAKNAQGPYCLNPKAPAARTTSAPLNKKGRNFYSIRKYYERDSAYLGLIEALIQDGPQLILQLYILAVRHHEDLSNISTAIFQAFSIVVSLASLSLSIVSYIQSSRWADPSKPQMTPLSYIFNFLWRFFIVFSRVVMLSLFATEFQREFFAFVGLHWLFMSMWIFMMGTNYCGSAENRRRPLAEVLYNIVMGFVCIFDYINLKGGPTRLKHLLYYTMLSFEAAILMGLWYKEVSKENALINDDNFVIWSHEPWYQWTSIIIIPTCFTLGLVFMFVYYKFFHPDGKMPAMNQSPSML